MGETSAPISGGIIRRAPGGLREGISREVPGSILSWMNLHLLNKIWVIENLLLERRTEEIRMRIPEGFSDEFLG